MQSSGALVDTSVWIDFFRGSPSTRALLQKLLEQDLVFTAGPILFELLQGLKFPEKRKHVKEALLSTHYLDITAQDWEEAASLSSEFRRKGLTLPMTDLLIARLAMNNNLEVISSDPHFDRIPGLKHHKL